MGRALTADAMFRTPEAAAFRYATLAGCRALDVDELRLLADELHDCARARRSPLNEVEAYSQDDREAPIFDLRL